MITHVETISHKQLPGVRVTGLSQVNGAGRFNRVLVELEPGSAIPMHSHKVRAVMTVVNGQARVVSENEDNGRLVSIGDIVDFHAHGLHGFQNLGEEPFRFLSESEGDGIVSADQHDWDIQFPHDGPLQAGGHQAA